MGNSLDKQEYTLINNAINCENTIDIETVTIETVTIETEKSINHKNITKAPTASLQTLITDITKSNNVSDVLKNYDEQTISDYYKSDSIIEIFKLNNDKALQLANALPVNKEKLIFKYFPVVPVNLMIIMSKNMNLNVLDNNKETFLFKKLKKGDMFIFDFNLLIKKHIIYITKFLNNVDNIDVNLTDKNKQTFFEKLISDRRLKDYDTTSNLIQSLEKQNYNFNKLDHNKRTFLTQMLIINPDMTFYLAKTINIKSFDITIESRWLYHILTHHLEDIHNYICYMFQRDDYVKLFFELYNKLYIDRWNDKFIIFIRKAYSINNNKTIECLNYKSDKGNTIIHLLALRHDKLTLQFIVNRFKDYLKIEPNNEGKTPLMLYNESSFKMILQ